MLDNLSAQLAAGKAISPAQAEAADRYFKAFHSFFVHHHHNEEGERSTCLPVFPSRHILRDTFAPHGAGRHSR